MVREKKGPKIKIKVLNLKSKKSAFRKLNEVSICNSNIKIDII